MKRIFLVFIAVLLLAGCGVKEKTTENNTNDSNTNIKEEDLKSSQVSKGVSLDDLGNITNGQYYFDSGDSIYYSSFDEGGKAHIYMVTDGNTKSIFNGFGWSFALKGDYIYFSGNEGVKIDGTYNLYRMKKDGSSYEKINSTYCFNMNFYKDWLYYVKANASSVYTLYRSDLDGKNEVQVVGTGSYVGIVYEDMLYYLSDNTIYRSNPDGSLPVPIVYSVYQFVIGMGKLIYTDTGYNIKSSDIDGTNTKVIKANEGEVISRINSYKNTVFYVVGSSTPTSGYSYSYTLYSMGLDGTNKKTVYSSTSYGYYINIINDKVYALDYNAGASGNFEAITKSMDLDGSNFKVLYR